MSFILLVLTFVLSYASFPIEERTLSYLNDLDSFAQDLVNSPSFLLPTFQKFKSINLNATDPDSW